MKIEIIEPHGFCAGVTAALKKALSLRPPVYCLHELVHNEIVVSDLRARGFSFVESVDEVPEGATVLFSAHGVSPAVRAAAASRRLNVVGATCPFVERVHSAARDFAAKGLPVVVVGNPSHAEVRGIVGEVADAIVLNPKDIVPSCGAVLDDNRVEHVERAETLHDLHVLHGILNFPPRFGLVSQTTMNSDEVRALVESLRARYDVETTADVCNATKVRQDAVRAFAGDALLVLGSANSSNTRRLCEVASCRTLRAGTMDEVRALDLAGVSELGVTSGASTPESFFHEAVAWLRAQYSAGGVE